MSEPKAPQPGTPADDPADAEAQARIPMVRLARKTQSLDILYAIATGRAPLMSS